MFVQHLLFEVLIQAGKAWLGNTFDLDFTCRATMVLEVLQHGKMMKVVSTWYMQNRGDGGAGAVAGAGESGSSGGGNGGCGGGAIRTVEENFIDFGLNFFELCLV